MIANMTPHPITFALPGTGERLTVAPDPRGPARVASQAGAVGLLTVGVVDIPFVEAPTWGAVVGLPDPEEGVIYVVSALVAGRVSRPDVFSPGTGPADGAIRGPTGQIEAVTRLVRSC